MKVTIAIMWGGFIPLTWFLIVFRDGGVFTAWMGASVCFLLMGLAMWRRFESGNWKQVEIFR